jgi:hypothetical protein
MACKFRDGAKKNRPTKMSDGFVGDPDEIRTHDPRLRRALLYPAELPDQSCFDFKAVQK